MALFFITALEGSEAIVSEAITQKFPTSFYAVDSAKWFLHSENVTAKEIFTRLLGDPTALPGKGCIIVTVSGYYGLASPPLWEWIAIQSKK